MSTNTSEATSAYRLEAVIPDALALKWHQTLLCGLFVSAFLFFAFLPVSSPTTWHHVLAGNEVDVAAGLPMSEGIRSADIDWLADVAVANLHASGGPELLSFAFACLQLFVLVCWGLVFAKTVGRWWAALASFVIMLVCLPWLNGLSGMTFGQLAFVGMFAILLRHRDRRTGEINWASAGPHEWLCVAVLFAVWANLHASFVLGLLSLLCLVADRFTTCTIKAGLAGAWGDREFRRRLWLFEFALVATLVNPMGLELWAACFWWPDNPIVAGLGDWQPTSMASLTAFAVGALWATLAFTARNRSVGGAWVAASVTLTILVAFSTPMVVWLIPVLLLAIASAFMTLPAASKPPAKMQSNEDTGSLKFAMTMVAAVIIWAGFSFSPWSAKVLGGKTRSESQLIGSSMPLLMRDHLRSNPSDGLSFCPASWSDWLQVETSRSVFVGSDASLFPEAVLSDYADIHRGASNWKRIAEKYAFAEILVDKRTQQQLARRINQDPGPWKVTYEDRATMLIVSEQ